jgi:tricorn protease-like protein
VPASKIAVLTERTGKAMYVNKLKIAALVLVVGGVIAVGMFGQQPILANPSAEFAGSKAENPRSAGEARDVRAPKILKLDGKGRKAVLSPDGKALVVVVKYGRGSAVKLWDLERMRERKTLAESGLPGLAFQHVTFSPDGKWIAATVSEGILQDVVKVWDAETLNLERKFEARKSQLVCVALSADGKRVAAGDPHDNTVKVWSIETGNLERTLKAEGAPWAVTFSPDGTTLLAGGQKAGGAGEVTRWDIESGKKKRTLKPEKTTSITAFSANAKMIAGSGTSGELIVWDLDNDKLVLSVEGDVGRAVAFSRDGKTVAAGCKDNKVRLWDVKTGKLTRTLEGHEAEVYSVAFASDGKTLVSVSQDQTARVWQIGN